MDSLRSRIGHRLNNHIALGISMDHIVEQLNISLVEGGDLGVGSFTDLAL